MQMNASPQTQGKYSGNFPFQSITNKKKNAASIVNRIQEVIWYSTKSLGNLYKTCHSIIS